MIRKNIVGYCDPLSACAGEKVQFKVSTYGPDRYRADLVRLVCGDDSPGGAGFCEQPIPSPIAGEYPGRRQPIRTGSYVRIPVPAGSIVESLGSFTIQALIWPTLPGGGRQAIVARWSEPDRAGFALFLDERGEPALSLGSGSGQAAMISTGKPVAARRWALVGASYNSASGQIVIYHETLAGQSPSDPAEGPIRIERPCAVVPVARKGESITLAAWHDKGEGVMGGHFNGKIDSPRIARRVFSPEEMKQAIQWPPPSRVRRGLVAAWDFSADIESERVTDRSANELHGETINLPARAMTGWNWDGSEQDWRHAPEQYGAIHFHEDDLYDAAWDTDFELTIGGDMRSGIYAARLKTETGEDYVPFFVRPPGGEATSKIALLASTATYMAYANSRLHFEGAGVEVMRGRVTVLTPDTYFLIEHPECGLSLYDHHTDGSGVCYSSRLRPVLDMGPKTRLWSLNADLHITAWLEAKGFDYDVITDEDLHAEGAKLLKPYQVVLTGSHPEYYSLRMLDAVREYLGAGGRLMYLGGNGFYWRIAYHREKRGVIEVRRAEDGTRAWLAQPGEYYHSFTGEYGGLWVRQRRAPQQLVGVGFAAQGFDRSTYYRRRPESRDSRAAFIFDGIEEEKIGDFGIVGGGAAGEEIDRFDLALGTPRHALRLASSENLSPCYMWTKEEMYSNVPGTDGVQSPRVRSDLTFFECPGGGAVFSTGSIAWSASLAHNNYENNVARMTTNVLRRFADRTPFEMPDP